MQGISFFASFVSVPLTIHYLGAERYSLCVTASASLALLGFLDFGISNGLLNVISESDGKDDTKAAAIYVSTSFFLLLAVAIAAGVVFLLAYRHVQWQRVFNVSTHAAMHEAGPIVLVLVFCFLVYLPITVTQRVQLGYQRGFVNYGGKLQQTYWRCSELFV
jgi:O-antigen/teichoic acid export membrane protein